MLILYKHGKIYWAKCLCTMHKSFIMNINFIYKLSIITLFKYSKHKALQKFLNQAHAGLWLARAWFLRIASVCECLYACVLACVCVCVHPQGYEQLVA